MTLLLLFLPVTIVVVPTENAHSEKPTKWINGAYSNKLFITDYALHAQWKITSISTLFVEFETKLTDISSYPVLIL